MRGSRVFQSFFGLLIILMGISLLFHILGWLTFNLWRIFFPALFIYYGVNLFKRGKRKRGSVIALFGAFGLLSTFGIHIGDVLGFIFSIFIVYVGYRLLRISKERRTDKELSSTEVPINEFQVAGKQHSLIGSLDWTKARWELRNLTIWQGIGEVKMDLSRAVIPPGETILVIHGWIGDIDIYVPYDVTISLITTINVGSMNVFGHKEAGVQRSFSFEPPGYHDAEKRVRIIVNLLVGELDIKYL
jgi:lia operon protein LiaF